MKRRLMFDKILNTFVTRAVSMLIMFVVVIINTNTFGAEGTGTIALVILGLTLLQVLSNFVGGSTLVFLTPQKDNFQLLILSYAWAVISNLAGLFILSVCHIIPREFTIHLLIITFIYSAYFIHVSIMQGKEDIRIFNALQLTQVLLLIAFLVCGLFYYHTTRISPPIDLYIYAYLFSYLAPTVISSFYIAKRVHKTHFNGLWSLLKEMFRLGFWTQLANLTQLLTYRLNYYLVEHFINRKSLGIYELGTRLSEAVWVFPKSICLVQYATISNNQDRHYAKRLTLNLLKIVLVFSILAVLVLWAIPSSFIAWVFGPEFSDSKPVICSLLPGIVFLSCSSILAHHFAGYGKYWINAVGSAIGLIVTASLGYIFIPAAAAVNTAQALQTAGWITSGAYFSTLVFSLICFIRITDAQGREFLLNREDIIRFKQTIREQFSHFKSRNK